MSGTRYFRRADPGTEENLKAGLFAGIVGASVASLSFYLVRLLLSRERMEPLNASQNSVEVSEPARPNEE